MQTVRGHTHVVKRLSRHHPRLSAYLLAAITSKQAGVNARKGFNGCSNIGYKTRDLRLRASSLPKINLVILPLAGMRVSRSFNPLMPPCPWYRSSNLAVTSSSVGTTLGDDPIADPRIIRLWVSFCGPTRACEQSPKRSANVSFIERFSRSH